MSLSYEQQVVAIAIQGKTPPKAIKCGIAQVPRINNVHSFRIFLMTALDDQNLKIIGLQSRSTQSTVAPSMAILEKLKEEMRNLRDIKKSIEPIGKFVLPSGSSQTGINTDHVDF